MHSLLLPLGWLVRLQAKAMTRPEKSLQFLWLILLYIYNNNINPDIALQEFFFLDNSFSIGVSLELVF